MDRPDGDAAGRRFLIDLAPGSGRSLIDELLVRCRFPEPGTPVSCAVSGGADSTAMLVLAVAAGCDATAFHVDHGLRAGSADEVEVVRASAARLDVPVVSLRARVEPGPNLEARARAARYGVLPDGVLTGHTLDDQAETVLLALVRGAGLDGLAGMEPSDRRPILRLRRSETVGLCAALALDTVADPSNADPAHRRNRIRHEVLPLLDAVADRDVAAVVARQADLLRDEARLLDELADAIDATDVEALRAAPVALARRAIRRRLRRDHPPSAADVARVLDVVHGRLRATEVGGRRVTCREGRLVIGPDGGTGSRC